MFSLDGRVALVTGGGSGLGRAMALALANRGANVAIVGRHDETVLATASDIERLGVRALGLHADVTAGDDAKNAVAAVAERLGRLDILVNNAGIAIPGPAESLSVADFRQMYEVDVFGAFSFAQAAFPVMASQNRGVIINIASVASFTVLRQQEHAAYNSAKAAVAMLTRSLAVEWARVGIRVNALAPGFMLTTAVEKARGEDPVRWAGWMAGVPLGRAGQMSELDGAVVYLASDASSYVTGSVLLVDGGYTCW
jgi:NAD(P)-dependent dehydrogenase (short-subunit alcohol dehydrogenase family)